MPSKYKQKAKPKRGKKLPVPYPVCTNCGTKCWDKSPTYSKCYCGGTFQTFGISEKERHRAYSHWQV